jgi:hypothetical protein
VVESGKVGEEEGKRGKRRGTSKKDRNQVENTGMASDKH